VPEAAPKVHTVVLLLLTRLLSPKFSPVGLHRLWSRGYIALFPDAQEGLVLTVVNPEQLSRVSCLAKHGVRASAEPLHMHSWTVAAFKQLGHSCYIEWN